MVFGAALLVHILLLSFPVGTEEETSIVRALVIDTLTPAERMVDLAISSVASVWNGYFNLIEVRRENERLNAEVDNLRMEIARNREAVNEADRLRRLVGLDALTEGDWRVGRVIGSDTDLFSRTVTIDKGSSDGVRLNATVMTPSGLVGRVVQTGRRAALVQLVSHRDSAVGVIVGTSRVQGIVRGEGSRYLELEYSDDRVALSPGDQLITSGTDQIFPKGLLVGVVASVERIDDLMSTASVDPAADLGRLEEVLWLATTPPDRELDPDSVVGASPRP